MTFLSPLRRASLLPIPARRFATRHVSHAIEAAPVTLDVSSLDTPQVYVSTSHDPWFNLSYEEWLFRNTPVTTPILFFYRNAPTVVIGRNQNPWKETTPALLTADQIPLIRRRSGGGAVFHPHIETRGVDSVRSPVTNLVHSRRGASNEEFIRSVSTSFVHVFRTGDVRPEGLKRILHDGKPAPVPIEVRLEEVLRGGDDRADKIRAGMDEMKTWEWVFGQTPEFAVVLAGTMSFGDISVAVTSKHGVITDCKISTLEEDERLADGLSRLSKGLVGQRYDGIDSDFAQGEQAAIIEEVVAWLRQSI